MTILNTLTSWIVFIFALAVIVQNIVYLKRNYRRRPLFHFAVGLLAIYMAGLYFTAAIDPTVYIIRSGLATKTGIIILFYLLWTVTKLDIEDYRLEDRIGGKHP